MRPILTLPLISRKPSPDGAVQHIGGLVMKLRLKIDDEVVSEIRKPSLLTDLVEQISDADNRQSGLEVLQEGATVLAEGTATLARLNQEFVRDTVTDAVAVAQSFGRIRTVQDFIEHQVGVGVMMVTGTVTQFERVRETLDITGQTLQQVLQSQQDNSPEGGTK